jgi:hypothetical protein
MVQAHLMQLIHSMPQPYGRVRDPESLRHHPYLLRESVILAGTVQEHLDSFIVDAEAAFQADPDDDFRQDRLAELLVYRARTQAARAALIRPRVRPPAGAPATPEAGRCCGNRSHPALTDVRLNSVVSQPHPPANYSAGAPAVLSKPFTTRGWS